MSPENKPFLTTVVLPLGCALLALGSVLFQMHRLNEAKAQVADTNNQIRLLDTALVDSTTKTFGNKIPAPPQTKEEDTVFLDEIKQAAQQANVTIIRWTSTPKPANEETNPPQDFLKGVTAIHSDLEVSGEYDSVLAFVVKLESWPRLLNMNNIAWHRGNQTGTRLFMNVIRYASAPRATTGAVVSVTGGSQ
jgi:hypothetical protein